jgi:serine/threonine protein kinase
VTIAPGSRLGLYEVIALLGRGGMGAVYRARDSRLRRDVALKVLPEHRQFDPEARARFEREALALAALNHPNIATVYGVENDDGVQALVMELIEGETLADRLDFDVGGLPIDDALVIARQITDALDAAHERGIIHRDLKPSNVKIRPDGTVKVLDFGLASGPSADRNGADVSAVTATRTSDSCDSIVVGTPSYMSPEQTRGWDTDRRTDIWAFGCVMYEMLAGRRAFEGPSSADTIAQVLGHEPDYDALPPDTPPPTRRLLRRCLEKDTRRRLRDIGDARVDLDESLKARTAPDRILAPPEPGGGARVAALRLPTAALVLSAVVVLGITYTVLFRSTRGGRAPSSRETVRLTFDDGLQTDPSFSPDGKSIAYASDKSGSFDIWTQPVSGGNPIRVTSDPAHDWQPNWSPTGSHIVFRSERGGGGIFVVPATGGFEQKIADFGYRPLWSPDGTQVLFTQVVAAGVAAPLYIANLDGRPPRAVFPELTPLLSAFGWYGGKTIVLLRSEAPAYSVDLRTIDVNDGAETRWTVDDPVARRFTELELAVRQGEAIPWSAGAGDIVFAGVSRGVSGIWRLDVDRRAARVKGGPHRISEMTDAGSVSLSADGRRLTFGVATTSPRLWSYPVDAQGVVVDEAQPITAAAVSASAPDLTMDGSQLLYVLARPASRQRRELIVRSLATSEERAVRVIDADRESLALARWTRDGRRISYAYLNLAGPTAGARLLDVASGQESELTSQVPTDARQPTWASHQLSNWSPNDEFVVSSGRQYIPGRAAIALLAASAAPRAERAARIVTSSASFLNQPAISPNGRWIAFRAATRSPGGKPTGAPIMVIGAEGGPDSVWRRLSASGMVWDDKPRWSADGRRLYFTSTRGGPLNVAAVDFDPEKGVAVGAPFQVTRFSGPGEQILLDIRDMELAVSRDRLIVPIVHPRGSIWMLDNFNER